MKLFILAVVLAFGSVVHAETSISCDVVGDRGENIGGKKSAPIDSGRAYIKAEVDIGNLDTYIVSFHGEGAGGTDEFSVTTWSKNSITSISEVRENRMKPGTTVSNSSLVTDGRKDVGMVKVTCSLN